MTNKHACICFVFLFFLPFFVGLFGLCCLFILFIVNEGLSLLSHSYLAVSLVYMPYFLNPSHQSDTHKMESSTCWTVTSASSLGRRGSRTAKTSLTWSSPVKRGSTIRCWRVSARTERLTKQHGCETFFEELFNLLNPLYQLKRIITMS